MSAGATFSDLAPRVVSGLLMAGVGAAALVTGSFAFDLLLIIAASVMHWELARLANPLSRQAPWFAAVFTAFFAILVFYSQSPIWMVIYFALHSFFQAQFFYALKRASVLTSLAILLAVVLLHWLRSDYGFHTVLWLICVVVLTDIGGYFGGRLVGGPKLAPRFSPKKTWSGALTGWILSFALTVVFVSFEWISGPYILLGLFALFISVTSQVSDICESALKRAFDAKDSSQLIPGHGGVMDRFDGLTGATIACSLCLLMTNIV